jgi:hypothetical protein
VTNDTTLAGRGSSARGTLAWLLVLALAAVVAWLFSERNARQWSLVAEDGKVLVKRGILFPVGRQQFKSGDPNLSAAYTPIEPPPGAKLPEDQEFDDRAALDQALYGMLAAWAREDIASGEASRLERGLGYLTRAEKLAGLTPTQLDDLKGLRAESAYYEAGRLLGRAADDLRQAAEKLRMAAGSRSPRGADAQALLHQIEPAVDAAVSASRAAAPAPATPTPARPAAPPVPAPSGSEQR